MEEARHEPWLRRGYGRLAGAPLGHSQERGFTAGDEGIPPVPMSPHGAAVVADDRRTTRLAIDREVVVTMLTWEEQERLRRRILRRVQGLARRFAGFEEAGHHGRLRESEQLRGA